MLLMLIMSPILCLHQLDTAPCFLMHDSVAATEFQRKLHASTLGLSMKLLAFNSLLIFIACATNVIVESAKDPKFAGKRQMERMEKLSK